LELSNNDIYEYINKLNFEKSYELIRHLVNIINNNISKNNSYQLTKIKLGTINPYIIDVSLKDIRENVNYGSFLLDRLEGQKQAECSYENSLDWHTKIQYDKFHKEE